ncbi:GDP-mannose 4,6-dehydratase [Nisaea acidiphila]|uniref:GDP-mannose 4,6-dehydratase n=1 Tax=Nisaea acidiphila TaxID=1862145 RepID=A0A9J7AMI9_9PROT|nr:NAD-dependent epimerase/dehydratase family protein [Nisaea acidiphila]UUX48383.1 GDP-mannose 4,6-dehydratase [Nisaea acidiphila]
MPISELSAGPKAVLCSSLSIFGGRISIMTADMDAGKARGVAVVTGGGGFIGSHMVDLLLAEKYEVRVVDNFSGGHRTNLRHHSREPGLKIFEADIRDIESIRPAFDGAQLVFHFAGIGDIVPSIERPIDYMATNVQGTVHVLECARSAGVQKFVYAASSSCYGLASTPTLETHLIQPQYPYALSKYQGEEAVMHWHQVYGLPANSVRIFNAYGTRVRTTGAYGAVFGVFLRQKLAGKPFTVVGDGNQRRDFIYASDLAKAFLAAARTEKSGEIYNAGGGNPQSINRLVELLGGEVVYVPKRPGEPDETWADITKIQSELGWAPEISFEDGVGRMLADIEHWKDAPLWDPDSIADATKTWFTYLSDDAKG